jgi:mannonate dehydratase
MMRSGVRTNNGEERRLVLAEQLGAQGGSIWASALPGFSERGMPDRDGLDEMRERFERHNLVLTGIGLGGEIVKAQLLGLPERERDIDSVCETIRRIGETFADAPPADRPVIIIDQRPTYWAQTGWKGSAQIAGRGGVRFYDFDASRDADQVDAPAGPVTLDQVWERMDYLYERIVPVAEASGILLATHPDDPPLPVYRGAAQALCSLAGFLRLFSRFPSPSNGMLLCLGCMQEAGEDALEVIRTIGAQGRIFYIHFRNVVGTVPHYTEVFPNMGDLDMVAALRALWDTGYDRFIVSDHQFGILDDDDWTTASHAWQIGYATGLMQATQPSGQATQPSGGQAR